jgi:hypothetical protein
MVWFFEHDGRFRRCEVHPEHSHYRLLLRYSDGAEYVEDYVTYDALVQRTRSLEVEWKRDGWNGPYGRDVR